jgi:hypothetical protein
MKVYPMISKSETPESLLSLIHHVGIPSSIHSDYAKEIKEGKFNKICQEYHIPVTTTEPYSPWQNRAEGAIREMKRHVRRKMHSRNVPQSLWDFCVKWSCDVRAKSAHKSFDLDGRTPYEVVMGDTPDISSLMDYDFYEPIWYYDEISQFPEPKRKMAQWLAEAHNVGQAINYFILPQSGIPIVRSSMQPISQEEKQVLAVQEELKQLDKSIQNKCKTVKHNEIPDYISHELDNEESDTPQFEPVEVDVPETDTWDPESYDKYISAQVLLPSSSTGHDVLGTVIGQKETYMVILLVQLIKTQY